MSQVKIRNKGVMIQDWKKAYADLEADLEQAEAENDALEGRLEEIADIASPDRAQADERIDRIEQLLVQLVTALCPKAAPAAPQLEDADADAPVEAIP